MKIEWNKVTWYSKVIAVVLAIGIFFLCYYLGQKKKNVAEEDGIKEEQVENKTPSVEITSKNIKEDNFTGKVAVVSGKTLLTKEAHKYIDDTVAEFRKQADTDVP